MLVAELAEYGITMATSTIHRVLVRRGISRLRDLDVNGEDMRKNRSPTVMSKRLRAIRIRCPELDAAVRHVAGFARMIKNLSGGRRFVRR